MDFVNYILAETSWLYTKIYQDRIVFLDLWSFVHLWTGFVVFMLLKALRVRPALLFLMGILLVYELAELLFIYAAFHLFRPETLKDQVTDILVGLAGGYLSLGFLALSAKYLQRHKHLILSGIMLLAAGTYAFLWVGFYQYHYDVEVFNTGGGMNFYTFLTWTVAGFLILQVFFLLRKQQVLSRVLYTWLIYFAGLMIFEYITYYIFGIHENSNEAGRAMVFGLVHGTITMHIFYLACPFLLMILFGIGAGLLKRITEAGLPRNSWDGVRRVGLETS